MLGLSGLNALAHRFPAIKTRNARWDQACICVAMEGSTFCFSGSFPPLSVRRSDCPCLPHVAKHSCSSLCHRSTGYRWECSGPSRYLRKFCSMSCIVQDDDNERPGDNKTLEDLQFPHSDGDYSGFH